jgi:hypothetical protein
MFIVTPVKRLFIKPFNKITPCKISLAFLDGRIRALPRSGSHPWLPYRPASSRVV